MTEYQPLYPDIKYPTEIDLAYKRAYGHYEYDNNFLKRFAVGYLEGLKDVVSDYPDY